MLSRRAHDARPQCHLKSLFSGTPANTRIIFILRMHPDLVSFGPLVQSAMSGQSDPLSQQLLSERFEARSPPVPSVLVTPDPPAVHPVIWQLDPGFRTGLVTSPSAFVVSQSDHGESDMPPQLASPSQCVGTYSQPEVAPFDRPTPKTLS